MTIVRLAAIFVTSTLLAACAPSGYSLDLTNNSSEIIRVEMMAQKGDDKPTLAAGSAMSPGVHIRLFSEADRKAEVRVEARVQGDDKTPPAIRKITLGLTKLVINPNHDAAKDASKPKLKIDEQY